MKNLIRTLFALLTLTALISAPASARPFEGKVVMEIRTGKKVATTTYLMKSGFLRLEMPNEKNKDAEPFATILRPADKQVIILMPEQKQYMVQAFDMEKTAAKAQAMTGAKVSSIEKTGRTDKICGYDVEEYVSKVGNDTVENWVVEGFGFFASPGGRGTGAGKVSEWEAALRDKGGFPLRTITRDSKGREKTRTEAILVEKQRLDDGLFLPPKGWAEFKMPAIPGLKDMLGGR